MKKREELGDNGRSSRVELRCPAPLKSGVGLLGASLCVLRVIWGCWGTRGESGIKRGRAEFGLFFYLKHVSVL